MTIYSELERKDTAIEVLSALRGYKVATLMREIVKPVDMQNPSLVKSLRKELLELGHDRFLMYKGDKKVINKILNSYSNSVKQNLSYGKNANGR